MVHLASVLVLAILVVPPALAGGVPGRMHVQGMILDNTGLPVESGTFQVTVRVYASQTAPAAVWTQVLPAVEVNGGLFEASLDAAGLAQVFPANGAAYLGFTVEAEPELPRVPFGSVAYAFHAASADSALGLQCTGCIGDQAVGAISWAKISGAPASLPPSGPAGGVLSGTYPNPGFAAGALVQSLNGLGGAVTIQGGENVTIGAAGSTLTISSTGGGGTGGPVVLEQGTLATVSVADHDLVNVRGTVVLSSSWTGLNRDQLLVQGGAFQGSGTQELDLGDGTTVVGTGFSNLLLDGNDVVFVNCTFQGAINFPHGATILGGVLNGVAQSTTHSLGRVVGATIDNSTILRAEGLSDCDIGSSTLGGTALNGNDFGYLADSRVNDSIIWVRSDDRITGNDLGDSHVRVWGQDSGGNASGLMVISGNNFDNILSGQTEALSVQMSTSSYWSLVVENNTFIVQSSDPQAISVGGTPGGSYQYQSLLISGNTFTKGQRAINYTGSLRTVVDGNVTRSTPLGVSASGNLQTGQNFNF